MNSSDNSYQPSEISEIAAHPFRIKFGCLKLFLKNLKNFIFRYEILISKKQGSDVSLIVNFIWDLLSCHFVIAKKAKSDEGEGSGENSDKADAKNFKILKYFMETTKILNFYIAGFHKLLDYQNEFRFIPGSIREYIL